MHLADAFIQSALHVFNGFNEGKNYNPIKHFVAKCAYKYLILQG